MTPHFTERLLARAFYERSGVAVARALLGQRLVRVLDGQRLSGLICETEAYAGPADQASHAYHRTPRSEIMYGPPGFAYVYLIYGMHHCLNAVTEPAGQAGAVLIRGIIPQEGVAIMQKRRAHTLGLSKGRGAVPQTDGPGKLCQALGITAALNGADLTASPELFIEAGEQVDGRTVIITPRIGVRGDEETRMRPWRFLWHREGEGVTGGPG